MKKAIKELLGLEVTVLLSNSEIWYELIPVTIDEEEDVVYFTDITEDDDEEESTFWELAVKVPAILAVARKTGKVTHSIEEYLTFINGDQPDGTDEGD